MKKLTLITLALVLMLGNTLQAAKKPDFTPQEVQQVKQIGTLLKPDKENYGFALIYRILSELTTYKVKDPIRMINTWVRNWQSGSKQIKDAQRMLYTTKFGTPLTPSSNLCELFQAYIIIILTANDVNKLKLISAGFAEGKDFVQGTKSLPKYPQDWDNLFYAMVKDQVTSDGREIKGFLSKLDEINKKIAKIKYKKLKSDKAVNNEFDDLINGGGTN